MSETPTTSFSIKCEILADLWLNHRENSEYDLEDFVSRNDIGVPLGFVLAEKLAVAVGESKKPIDDTFQMLLDELGLSDDGHFENLEHIIEYSKLYEPEEDWES